MPRGNIKYPFPAPSLPLYHHNCPQTYGNTRINGNGSITESGRPTGVQKACGYAKMATLATRQVPISTVQMNNKNYKKTESTPRPQALLRIAATHRHNGRVSIRFCTIKTRDWSVRQVSRLTTLADCNFLGYRPAVYTDQHQKTCTSRGKTYIKK